MGEQHTKGEWLIDRAESGRAYGVSAKNKGGYRVPVVVWRGIAKPASPEGQANARLMQPDKPESAWAKLQAAKAAIAKATGTCEGGRDG